MAPPAAAAADDGDLLLEMRRATRRAHSVANALILAKLAVVLTDRGLYAAALTSFLPVYEELEKQMAVHAGTPGPLSLVIAAAQRVPSRAAAMRADAAHLLHRGPGKLPPPPPAAQAYADHLRALGEREPLLLLPYVFSLHVPILLARVWSVGLARAALPACRHRATRGLTDRRRAGRAALQGFLGRRVARALRLPDERGVAFFEVDDKAGALAALRGAVTAAGRGLSAAQRGALCDEAVTQFRLNNGVVAAYRVGWRPVLRALARALAAARAFLLVALLAVAAAALWRGR